MSAPLPENLLSSEAGGGEALPTIADHVLLRRIGKGAYGEVWLAKNVIGGFRAAKVVYRKTFSDNRPFEREFEGIRKFDPISRTHPGLVTILQVGENLAAGYFYYVMELADDVGTGQSIETETYVARTLAHELTTPQRLPLEKSLPIGLALASALTHLHAQKLIHRDIKPSNIIFVKGAPKFADIGLITEAGKDVSSVGSLNYMPPEGPGESTADVFSLGKVFYGIFMGMPVKCFPDPPDAAEEFTTVPALLQLNSLILKACHRDPTRRFQTADELHKALLAVSETVQGKAGVGPLAKALSERGAISGKAIHAPEGQPVASGVPPPKVRWGRWAALLLLLLAITGAVFKFMPQLPTSFPSPGVATTRVPVVVLMDTTAPRVVYDEDNKKNGRSNAKELYDVLPKRIKEIPPENVHEVPVGLDWARQDFVRSLRPDLVLIHRSVFYHPAAAHLNFPYPLFKTPEEHETFVQRYKILGDKPLRDFLGFIGTAMPHTRFLVYSRGTDTNWLSAAYHLTWTKELEDQYPLLVGRVTTMLVPGGTNGTFRERKTQEELIHHVRTILKLPEKGD